MLSLEWSGKEMNIFGIAPSNLKNYIKIELSAFEDGLLSKLTPTAFKVFITIYSFMDRNKNCKATLKEIACRSGVSTTTVKNAIKELKEYQLGEQLLLPKNFY